MRTLSFFRIEPGKTINICVEIGVDAVSFGKVLFRDRSESFVYRVIGLELNPEARIRALLTAAFVLEKTYENLTEALEVYRLHSLAANILKGIEEGLNF